MYTRTVVPRTIVFYFLSSPNCHALYYATIEETRNDIYIYKFPRGNNSKGLAPTVEGSVFRDI